MGKLRKRMSFSRIEEILDMPDLIEVQKNSYKRFLEVDLKEVLDDVNCQSWIICKTCRTVCGPMDQPKFSGTLQERDMTYAAPLKVFVRLKQP